MRDVTAARERLREVAEAAKDKAEAIDEQIQALTRERADMADQLAHLKLIAEVPDEVLGAMLDHAAGVTGGG